MAKCTFLGLGVMGYPMAGHLVANGHDLSVWNRTAVKAQAWREEYGGEEYGGQEYGGKVCTSIADAVSGADYVMLCVGDDPDVYALVQAALPAMRAGSVMVDHTTASSECARTCYADAQVRGIAFIDAPVSGGEVGAIKGQLTIMCGGDVQAYERALPIMHAYAKAVKLMGKSGAGQMTKMVNQICIAGVLQGLAEGVHFAQKAGLDIDDVVEAIGQGAAQSWQMDNRARTMGAGEYEFGFAVDWMRKDLAIALRTAEQIGAKLELTQRVDAYYADVQKQGGGRYDTSSLLKRLNSGQT